jgi:long-chain acyl-CoA synthetase
LCTLPLFHISGLQTVLLTLLNGGRLVFLDGRFDAAEVLRLIEDERVTSWAAIPTMVTMVLEHADLARRDTSSLTSVAVGGAPVPADLRARIECAFPATARRTGESYGSTEAGGTVATTSYDKSSGTAGPRPFPNIDLRILAAGAGGDGEILVRSASVMEGYLGVDPEEQPVDVEGWLHTGDLGRVDEYGILHVTGRVKELIIRGGENIAPAYVESALRDHPAVAEAVVVGVPHASLGEEVGAVVRLSAAVDETVTTDDLHTFLAGRIASFAVPSRWVFTSEPLPLTDTGKVRRADLREWFA